MITKPTFLIDKARCKANIQKMTAKAKRHGLSLRPHFKTHQSLKVGQWFREAGVTCITVSSLSMAEYFADEWQDITVAFPVNILEIETINTLSAELQLNLLVESAEAVSFLQKEVTSELGIFVKIDVGYHRTGLSPDNSARINTVVDAIANAAPLTFKGFLAHTGHSYDAKSKNEILERHEKALGILSDLKERFRQRFPQCIASLGDTPSCSIAENFVDMDEIRPGNFVYYDLTQHQLGSNTEDEIAVAMACPIVALHPERNEVVIYGGGVHFSKDRLEDEKYGTIYGKVVEPNADSWGGVIPDMYLKKISQEHGVVAVPAERIADYKLGDILMVLPVHSCMAANLMLASTTLSQQASTVVEQTAAERSRSQR